MVSEESNNQWTAESHHIQWAVPLYFHSQWLQKFVNRKGGTDLSKHRSVQEKNFSRLKQTRMEGFSFSYSSLVCKLEANHIPFSVMMLSSMSPAPCGFQQFLFQTFPLDSPLIYFRLVPAMIHSHLHFHSAFLSSALLTGSKDQYSSSTPPLNS